MRLKKWPRPAREGKSFFFFWPLFRPLEVLGTDNASSACRCFEVFITFLQTAENLIMIPQKTLPSGRWRFPATCCTSPRLVQDNWQGVETASAQPCPCSMAEKASLVPTRKSTEQQKNFTVDLHSDTLELNANTCQSLLFLLLNKAELKVS